MVWDLMTSFMTYMKARLGTDRMRGNSRDLRTRVSENSGQDRPHIDLARPIKGFANGNPESRSA
jgi:hypothetical protein